MAQARPRIPLLLLKTRSQPNDAYQDCFSSPPSSDPLSFQPTFIPVLSYAPHKENLSKLETLLRHARLKDEYGGMIFTSQRAVEAFSTTIATIAAEQQHHHHHHHHQISQPHHRKIDPDFLDDTPFPLYVVGPATQRTLAPLLAPLTSITSPHLNPVLAGQHTGNGATLAPFIRRHYNALHAMKLFTFYEAPRLPYVPLLGAGGENYSRRRLERDDGRLAKKPLLFLVGEQRRDVIGRVLMEPGRGGAGEERVVEVVEVEVYRSSEVEGFAAEFARRVDEVSRQGDGVGRENGASAAAAAAEAEGGLLVVVVFSPQGCEGMLKALGLLGEDGKVNQKGTATARWDGNDGRGEDGVRYVIATIGPTTRDFLRGRFGFEADVCARTPSPEGVGEGVREFLRNKGVIG